MKKVRAIKLPCNVLQGTKETVSVFWPTPNSQIFNEIVHMLAVGLGPRQCAGILKIPYTEFCRWYLNGSIRTQLTLSRNAEIESRRRADEEKKESEERRNKLRIYPPKIAKGEI